MVADDDVDKPERNEDDNDDDQNECWSFL
jgi:hypothetical protein